MVCLLVGCWGWGANENDKQGFNRMCLSSRKCKTMLLQIESQHKRILKEVAILVDYIIY